MHLPGRLRSTTLGDLLGLLHRSEANGTLELVEERGRTHRVHLTRGLVVAIEFDGAASSLSELLRRDRAVDDDTLKRSLLRALASQRLHGEVLVHDFHLSPGIVDGALRRQLTARLLLLDQLDDARVHFRVAMRPPRGALLQLPLEAREFLTGRRRARDRASSNGATGATPPPPPSAVRERDSIRPPSAWRVLGLAPGADPLEIKRAFRKRARELHPDLHPGASDAERRILETRFAEVTAAYRALVA